MKRLNRIISRLGDEMIICPDCKEKYLPFSKEAEEICPICGVEINDPDESDLEELY